MDEAYFTCRVQDTENELRGFSVFRVEESPRFSFPVVKLVFQKLALLVVEWSEVWSEILNPGLLGKFGTF